MLEATTKINKHKIVKTVKKVNNPATRHRNLVSVNIQKQTSIGTLPQWTNLLWVYVGKMFDLTTIQKTSFSEDLQNAFGSDNIPESLLKEISSYFMQTNANGIINLIGITEDTTDLSEIIKSDGPLWVVISKEEEKDINSLIENILIANKFVVSSVDPKKDTIIENEKALYFSNNPSGLMGAALGVYLSNANSFGLYAPLYGLQIQGIDPLYDETEKALCAENNINFYTEANEDNPTGQYMLKEGVGVTGEDIDKTLSFHYIKTIANQKFVQFLLSNGGINLKIGSTSIYKLKLSNIFRDFITEKLILSFSFISDPIVNSTGKYSVEMEVKYNGNIKENTILVLEGE